MASEDNVMKYIKCLPPDMKYVIKTFIPISVLKKVRKIKENELPRNYKIAKALNEHFYMTSVGYKLDINSVNNYINFLERRLVHLNRKFNDTFNTSEFCQLTTSKIVTTNLLKDKKADVLLPTIMYYLHNKYYANSSYQLQSYNIIEVE